jgi:amidase
VGMTTTFGMVPVEGVRPLAPTLDTVGLIARDVSTVAQGMTMLDGRLTDGELAPSPSVGRFRLEGTDPTIEAAIDSALIEAGLAVIDIDLPGWEIAHAAALTVLFGEALIVNEDLWRHHHLEMGADLVERFTFAQAISPAELGDARAQREPWRQELADVLGTVGVLALPTMYAYPARIGEHAVAPNPACPAISLSGHPALTLPIPSGGLLPAALQLVVPDHHEARLLATAASIEAATS